jgi:hypothetical protein
VGKWDSALICKCDHQKSVRLCWFFIHSGLGGLKFFAMRRKNPVVRRAKGEGGVSDKHLLYRKRITLLTITPLLNQQLGPQGPISLRPHLSTALFYLLYGLPETSVFPVSYTRGGHPWEWAPVEILTHRPTGRGAIHLPFRTPYYLTHSITNPSLLWLLGHPVVIL